MNRSIILGFSCFIFFALSTPLTASATYQRVTLKFWDGYNGYLDKEISPGVYILEVIQIGGYVHDMEVLKKHWLCRADELCPNGYSGNFEVILPCQAKLGKLRNNLRYAQQYPMVSGIIRAKH